MAVKEKKRFEKSRVTSPELCPTGNWNLFLALGRRRFYKVVLNVIAIYQEYIVRENCQDGDFGCRTPFPNYKLLASVRELYVQGLPLLISSTWNFMNSRFLTQSDKVQLLYINTSNCPRSTIISTVYYI